MSTETNTTVIAAPAASSVSSPAASPIVFTVKARDIVEATVAQIKNHPDKGVLVVIPGNPMAFMPNGCIAGKNDAEKTARRAALIATPGSKLSVTILSEPTIETVTKTIRGKKQNVQVGRIKVSEQAAVITAEKAQQVIRQQQRSAAIETIVDSLLPGTVVEGRVRGAATKASDRKDGSTYTYGAFISVADGVSGLLHVRQISGGHQGLEAILKAGTVTVEIVEAKMDNGQPRIQLSQKSVEDKAVAEAFYNQYPVDAVTTGEIVKLNVSIGNMSGRLIRLASGAEVFLSNEDMNVKNESSLAAKKSTRVKITDEVVDGIVRVTRVGL